MGTPHTHLTVGHWRVEPTLNQLSAQGRVVAVEPLTMDLLLLLARNAGQVVSADTIVGEVWRGHNVSDNPVYKHVGKLRRALGDDSREPSYIETVPKRGYRLIAPVVETALAPGRDSAVAQSSVPAAGGRRRYALMLLVCLLGLAIFAFRDGGDTGMTLGNARQVTVLPGIHRGADFAPDGTSLVLAVALEDVVRLWLVELATGQAEPLAQGARSCEAPTWSPDNGSIAYHCGEEIWISQRDPTDSTPRLVTRGSNPDFSAAGELLAFERDSAVWIRDLRDDTERRIIGLPDSKMLFLPRSPRFSPDERSLVYFEASEGPTGDLWRLELATGEKTRLTRDKAIAGGATWSPDGASIVFSSRRGGNSALWRIPRGGGKAVKLSGGLGDDRQPVFSPDGQRVAWINSLQQFSLMLTNPTTQQSARLAESRYHILAPTVSPDGLDIAYFGETGGGSPQLFLTALSGGSVRQLTSEEGVTHSLPQWSGDGQSLYFYQTGGGASFRRIPAAGGLSELVIDNVMFEREHDLMVDPGGMRALYARLDRDRVVETRIVDLQTGAERVFERRISWVDWSRDGQRLAATDFSEAALPVGGIVLCQLDGECRTLAPRGQHPVWSADEALIYFVVPHGGRLNLYAYDLAAEESRELMVIGPVIDYGPFFDITPRGEVVWVRYAESEAKLWIADVESD